MRFLHRDFMGGSETVAKVTLDSQANVLLLDDNNFSSYRSGSSFQYRGGLAKRSPVLLSPPYHDHWHVVVDLGGYTGTVRAAIEILN